MKQLSIQEKAKAYGKAREKIALRFGSNVAEEIFSEFEVSEDERIRKALIKAIKMKAFPTSTCGGELFICGQSSDKCIAWLEKQGQTFTNKDVDDAYLKGVTDAKNEIEKQYEENYQIRKDIATFIFNYRGDIKDRAKWMDYLGIKVSFAEKQGEQNPAYKGESKFKVGDWVVDNSDNIWQVVEVSNTSYRLKDINNSESLPKIKWADETFHLWTLKDARDGDVLTFKDDDKQYPFIYKGCLDSDHPNSPVAYCGLNSLGKVVLGGEKFDYWWTDRKVHPATKEQHDTLMKAMADAGYTFDFGKKELKKIEPESENFKRQLMDEITDLVTDYIQQKPAEWSEEDEEMLQGIWDEILANKHDAKEYEWKTYDKFLSWLKSIKERYTWKPSDEQMASITCAVRKMKESACYDSELVSLYQDLKKLKGE